MGFTLRQATPSDSDQILEIYRPIVEGTVISFETESPTRNEISRRIESALVAHEWLVAVADGEIAGYAYASPYRQRHAYRFSVETTVYIRQSRRGQGLGRMLYEKLFESLGLLGYRSAFAGIALPNDASVALHAAMGFEPVGVFKAAGFKFDDWHDVSWWQRKVQLDN